MAANGSNYEPEPISAEEAAAYRGRDLRSVSWFALEGVRRTLGFEKGGATMASLARVILAMGESSEDRQEAADVAIVSGMAIHGFPPRNEHEWEIAGRIWEPGTVAKLREWEAHQNFLGAGSADGR